MNDKKFDRQNDDYSYFKNNVNNQFDNEFSSPNFGEEQVEIISNFVVYDESPIAKVSFIIGLISLGALTSLFPLAIVTSPYAIICGIISLVTKPEIDRNKAVLGLVFGCISFLLSLIIYILLFILL